MIIYAFVIILVLCLLFKERECLGCSSILSGEDCNNLLGKAVIGTAPNHRDSNSVLFSKIKHAADYKNRFVTWRGFVIVSFLIMLGLWFVIFKKYPSEWELVTGMVIIFLGMSLTANFYKFHLSDLVRKNIYDSVDLLKSTNM